MTNKIRIKICGMRDPENIVQVAGLQPDYMGFIFYPRSKRFVGVDFAIPEQMNKSIKRVGVFVNEGAEEILRLSATHRLNFVQLHGNESVDQCIVLKEKNLNVIKVFSVDDNFNFSDVKPFKRAVNYFLFDTKTENYGGSGRTFDWGLLNQYDQEMPFFLSGGLSEENVNGIKKLKGMNLHALDLNNGVEISPGLKDMNKIKTLKNILNS